MTNTHYLIRSAINPALILTTTGEMLHESLLGPGGRSAKLYKTERGARNASASSNTIHPCDKYGVEHK